MGCAKEDNGARAFLPLLEPNPAKLSLLQDELAAIEASLLFSNFGPTNKKFEAAVIDSLFAGRGWCTTVCNATIGLLLALARIRRETEDKRRYALMPAFTFAATAQAALWAGLTPLLCDIEPDTWLASPASERRLLDRYCGQVAAIMPCTTLGNAIDLTYYKDLAAAHRCGIVVDAASALGTCTMRGDQFGRDSDDPIIFSMHATKAFAVGEGGLVYSADKQIIEDLRNMSNFGFDNHVATTLGLNGKLSEVAALLATKKLEGFFDIAEHRHGSWSAYRAALPEFEFQAFAGSRWAPMFVSILLPREIAHHRDAIRERMRHEGIGTGAYFSPHLANQPYFAPRCAKDDLSVSDDVSRRIIALPMNDGLSAEQILWVASVLRDCCAAARERHPTAALTVDSWPNHTEPLAESRGLSGIGLRGPTDRHGGADEPQ